MKWRDLFAVVCALALASCTRPNPLNCSDGTCTDPAFPFCDVEGAFGDTRETCVAVECTPGEFELCRGDQAITCNAVGSDFDLVQCPLGCDPAVGCRLCEAGQTACTNGTVATCDTSGAVVAMESCPLGCFEDEPRCREIDPSNGLATYLDSARSAPDLDLSAGGQINTTNGEVRDANNAMIDVPSMLVPAPPGGAPIRVFVAKNVRLGDVHVFGAPSFGSPALAIAAGGTVTIEGQLSLFTRDNEDSPGGPGALFLEGCVGQRGRDFFSGELQCFSGGGGGAHATPGMPGGNAVLVNGTQGGTMLGNPSLEPLRGGCHGSGGGGGGALQIVSRRRIVLMNDAMINANGNVGTISFDGPSANGGGGAGGGILLEAPEVALGMGATLVVNGGPAAASTDFDLSVSTTRAPSPGGVCVQSTMFRCGHGGNGAAADGPPTAGGNATSENTGATVFHGGGGGGGLGFIRINTATGEFTKTSSSIESGVLTTARLRTR